ncbi:hypothetical protein BDN72DRAFT_830301 [Pluteus cervinus]|uniref:Uncharacterized protein n=1 Tax=Pluteus cervinus TaxID=181527 RepID=A0ACD3BGW7_9AGAR|nr:hypothetical protein BDN72DRAFT_830301 [Pluteus cervinus]
MVINRDIFARNCVSMHHKAQSLGAGFRAHVKTHKTAEGTRLQLVTSVGQTDSVVVSTLAEAWGIINSGLTREGTVKDILYGLPVGSNKIADLSALWDEAAKDGGVVRLLVDHPKQIQFLEEFEKIRSEPRRWSVFVKVDRGEKRAGIPTTSQQFKDLLTVLFQSSAVSVHGFYAHGGKAYGSTSLADATSFLSSEAESVNTAARMALEMFSDSPQRNKHTNPFVLSIGSTPTAHAAGENAKIALQEILNGKLELHAGNYPLLDLQQIHTNLVERSDIAQRVRATVISYYPHRGSDGEDEALIDAGALAFSKDTGPSGGYGDVTGLPWQLSRMSQEHGILTRPPNYRDVGAGVPLEVGQQVEIIGQHACLIAAGYPWYYIVEGKDGEEQVVVDVWVPWKGW